MPEMVGVTVPVHAPDKLTVGAGVGDGDGVGAGVGGGGAGVGVGTGAGVGVATGVGAGVAVGVVGDLAALQETVSAAKTIRISDFMTSAFLYWVDEEGLPDRANAERTHRFAAREA